MTFPAAPGATFGPPPSPYPVNPAPDPTDIVGRRTVAWLIDFALFFVVLFVLFSQLAVQDTQFGTTCDLLQDNDVTSVCLELNGDPIFLDDSSDTTILNLFSLAWFVGIYVIVQGFTGATPGKFLLGLRVVDESGTRCGPIKSLIRSLLWIVDGAPWFLPGLVGFVTGLTSTGHRRVGDMAASTYVIEKKSVGSPITVGGNTGIPNYAPTGPQSAYGAAWTPNPDYPVTPQPAAQTWGVPDNQPPTAPGMPGAPMAPDAPPAPTPPVASVVPPADTSSEPQWDAARNTYIQWNHETQQWLAWDDTSSQWDPI